MIDIITLHNFKMNKTLVSIVSLISVATIGYLIYFDRRRQTDPAFRKMLSKFVKQSHEYLTLFQSNSLLFQKNNVYYNNNPNSTQTQERGVNLTVNLEKH